MTQKSGGASRRTAAILVTVVILIVAAGAYYYLSPPQPSPMHTSTMRTSGMSSGMSMAPIQQNTTTADYRLQLIIGPPEQMLMMNQTSTARAGEVMVGGQMVPMTMGTNMKGMYHLEVHIYRISSGLVVADPKTKVTIQAVNDATHQAQNVPIAVMYDITVGVSDTHFGNNVTLSPGNYTITANIAGETATFHVTIPST